MKKILTVIAISLITLTSAFGQAARQAVPNDVGLSQLSLAPNTLGAPSGSMAGYVVGDTITLQCSGVTFSTSPAVRITGVSTGAVTSVTMTSGGVIFGALPVANVSVNCSQASTSGSGTGYSTAASLGPDNSSVFLAGDLSIGYTTNNLTGGSTALGTNGGITLSGGPVPAYNNCFWNDVNTCTTENVRARERFFVGNAVLMTDSSSTCCSGTWLGTNSTATAPIYLARDAQMLAMSDNGTVALSGMTRSSDGASAARASIGVSGYALLNPSGVVGEQIKAYGSYLQCDNRETGGVTTGVCYGAEIDAVNYGPNQTGDAYGAGFGTFGLWMASGGSQSPTNPANSVLVTAANGSTFNQGIIFGDGSLTKDGNGNSVAMSMGQGATLNWMVSGGVIGAQIRATTSTASSSIRQLFSNNQVEWDNTNGTAIFTATHVSNGINGVVANDAATGSPPVLRPAGADTNIGFDLHSKGTGPVRLYPGTDTAGAIQINNAANSTTYFSVDTSAGLVKLPTITTDAGATDATLCRRTSNGDILSGTGTIGICLGTSSARFKHAIEPLMAGIDQIMKLEPVSYKLNEDHGDPNKILYGFTAEQGGKVLPALAGADDEGKPNTFDYLGVVPVLVKGMQQLKAENDSLRACNDNWKCRIFGIK